MQTETDEQLNLLSPPEDVPPLPAPGRFHGADATATERASGEAIAARDDGRLKPMGAGHRVLLVYGDGNRRTAYDASYRAEGDYHSRRRESTRLYMRGFLEKAGTLPNHAPNGRGSVDAYRITESGRDELARLAGTPRA